MKNKRTTIKTYDLFMFIALFIYLVYPYNFSLIDIVIKNQSIIILLYLFSGLLMLLANVKYIPKNQNTFVRLLIMFVIFFFIVFKNGDIKEGHYFLPFFSIFTVYTIFILSFNDRWFEIALKLIIFFTIEHIFATFFTYLFSDFYYNNVLNLFPDYSRELIYQFNHNQIAGITHHYSTNALYLVVGLITLVFNNNIFKSKKTSNILFVLNFIALLMTGKRAQVVFFIISIILIILFRYRKNIIKTFSKLLFGFIAIVCGVVVISFAIPTIGNSFTRAFDSLNDNKSMASREILYDVAKTEFESNKIMGIGWGNYRYVYNKTVVNKERDYLQTHCIYLQLLCEVGIVGFITFMLIFICLIIRNLKIIKIIEKNINLKDNNNEIINYLYFYLLFIIYFLLEGSIGNSIYDKQIYMPFALITASFICLYHNLVNKKALK